MLAHYLRTGGEPFQDRTLSREMPRQAEILRQASALAPDHFIPFFEKILSSGQITDERAAPVFEGVTDHLLFRSGDAPPPGNGFTGVTPSDTVFLGNWLLHALRCHDFLWDDALRIAGALRACGHVADTPAAVSEILSCQLRLAGHRDPEPEKNGEKGNDPACVSRNSVRGQTAESAAILTLTLLKKQRPLPDLMPSLLLRFATDIHPGVRVGLLRHLTRLARYDARLAWQIHHAASRPLLPRLWPSAEPFLQHQYPRHFTRVKGYLVQARQKGLGISGTSWGKSLATACLSGTLSARHLAEGLGLLASETAWLTAFDVLKQHLADPVYRAACTAAMENIIGVSGWTPDILDAVLSVFEDSDTDSVDIALQIAYKFTSAFNGLPVEYDLSDFYYGLLRLSALAPIAVRQVCEAIISGAEESPVQRRIWQTGRHSELIRVLLQDTDLLSRYIRIQSQGE
ncbi:hypothetical protein DENIS_0217 [Desulfonema ishimotonii]|uniref:HEAT repeat domain-containing protein n=1 Tax=Desulfonema ishimotonii TaxID=45657 RepID=A0A401FQM7_9BACT|nr:hypothetical protein DENIS_0217 [Desulfonema ishimotonii]